MRYENFILKIIKFGLVAGSFFCNSRLLAENLKTCPKGYSPPPHTFDKNGGMIVNVKKGVVDANNNESLREHLSLLELKAVENYSRFMSNDITSTPTKYGGMRLTEKFNTSWGFMKKSIASIEEINICTKDGKIKDIIFLSARWAPKSIAAVGEIIKYENARRELIKLRMEDPKFNYMDLVKKYPNAFKTDDPKIILEAIDHWKKFRRF